MFRGCGGSFYSYRPQGAPLPLPEAEPQAFQVMVFQPLWDSVISIQEAQAALATARALQLNGF